MSVRNRIIFALLISRVSDGLLRGRFKEVSYERSNKNTSISKQPGSGVNSLLSMRCPDNRLGRFGIGPDEGAQLDVYSSSQHCARWPYCNALAQWAGAGSWWLHLWRTS